MKQSIRELSPILIIEKIGYEDDIYYISCHTKKIFQECPNCKERTNRIHSKHSRRLQDIPIQNHTVFLDVSVKLYRCKKCKKIFTESLTFANNTAHKTNRLVEHIMNQSCTTSSITAQNQLNKQGIQVKKSTICSLQKKRNTNNRL